MSRGQHRTREENPLAQVLDGHFGFGIIVRWGEECQGERGAELLPNTQIGLWGLSVSKPSGRVLDEVEREDRRPLPSRGIISESPYGRSG